MTLQAFSTDDDQDLIGEAFSVSEACSAAMLEEMMSGADEDAVEIEPTRASMDGFSLIQEPAEGFEVAVAAGQNYGQNHFSAKVFPGTAEVTKR